MFSSIGHRQLLVAVFALSCVCSCGCSSKTKSATSKTNNSAKSTAPARDILKEPKSGDVSELVALLSSKEPATRIAAANALGTLKADAGDAVGKLEECLTVDDADLKTASAKALAAIGGSAAISGLAAAAVAEQDADVRSEMWTALGVMGATSAFGHEAMADDDRKAAINGLKTADNSSEQTEAITVWLSSKDSAARLSGLSLLKNAGDNNEAVIARVVEMLIDDDEGVRVKATEVVKTLKLNDELQATALAHQFQSAENDERKAAIQQQLAESSDGISTALVQMLSKPEITTSQKASMLGLLSGQPQERLKQHAAALQSTELTDEADDETKNLLASILLAAGGKPSQDSLLNLAVSPNADSDLRIQALSLLEASEDPEVSKQLAAALKQVAAKPAVDELPQELAVSLLAAIKMQGANGAAATENIASLISDENKGLNEAVLSTLMAVSPKSAETTSTLRSLLSSSDSATRTLALSAMGQADDSQLNELAPQLAELLGESSPEDRQVVLGLLNKTGPAALAAAAPAIANSLVNSSSPADRLELMGLLSQVDSSKVDVSESLVSALQDKNPEIASKALQLLSTATPQQIAKVSPALAKTLESNDAKQNSEVLKLLAKGGQPALDAAAPAITKALNSSPQRIETGQILKLLSNTEGPTDAFAPALAAMTAGGNQATQTQAMELLNRASPEVLTSVGPELSKQVGSVDSSQLGSLLSLLTKAGGKSSKTAAVELAKRIETSDDSQDRQLAMGLLSNVNLPADKKRAAAMAALSDDDEDVRAKALSMLAESGAPSPEVVQQLMSSVNDESAAVRKQALLGLASAGHDAADAKPMLQKLLADTEDPESRRLALSALSKMTAGGESSELLTLALNDSDLRSESAMILANNPVQGMAVVVDAVQSDDPETARFAADLLAKMSRNKDGRKGLAALAKSSDEHRGLALMNLGKVPGNVSQAEAAESLVPFLRQGEGGDRAWKLMSGLGADALSALDTIVSDDQMAPEARKRALKMIAGSDDMEIAGPILQKLIADDKNDLGTEAAIALAMSDPTSEAAASRIAAEVANPNSTFKRSELMSQLQGMKTDQSDAMRSLLTASGTPEAIRQKALEQLLQETPITDETAVALQAAAAIENSAAGLSAAMKLAEQENPPAAAVQRLTAELRNTDQPASSEALQALAKMGPAAAGSAAVLAEVAKRDPSNLEVLKAITALGKDAGPALDAVRAAMESDDPEIRGAALEALIASNDSSPSTIEALQRIEDPELKTKVSEVITVLEQQNAESAAASFVGADSSIGCCEGVVASVVDENCCWQCDVVETSPMACMPVAECQPSACTNMACEASCHQTNNCNSTTDCQPTCGQAKPKKVAGKKVKIKTVSYRKFQKFQSRMKKRSRR